MRFAFAGRISRNKRGYSLVLLFREIAVSAKYVSRRAKQEDKTCDVIDFSSIYTYSYETMQNFYKLPKLRLPPTIL
jgi:hypothetical protein